MTCVIYVGISTKKFVFATILQKEIHTFAIVLIEEIRLKR
jgi:hypothetical protein